MNLSPIERYQRDLLRPDFLHDPAQARAVQLLQALYDNLVQVWSAEQRKGYFAKRLGRLLGQGDIAPVKGLYFWGGVGRGKTYLMDNFFESLPLERKMRV